MQFIRADEILCLLHDLSVFVRGQKLRRNRRIKNVQQQFKRSCIPDGPKVGSVTLSPRGDWRMPSDASGSLWLAEAETL